MHVRRLALAVSLAASMLAIAPVASAQEEGSNPPDLSLLLPSPEEELTSEELDELGDVESPESGLVITGDESEGPEPLLVLPTDCVGKTLNPHYSAGDASVHGRTVCKTNKAGLSVQTKLYRDDWWGWNLMKTDYSSTTGRNTSYDAHPHASCNNAPERTYRGYSSHKAILNNGDVGTAATWNNESFPCSPPV